jgi:hypothetical protein
MSKKLEKISENLGRLAEWYAANKPNLRHITISAADAQILREAIAKDEEKRTNDFELSGFTNLGNGAFKWRNFELLEQKPANSASEAA